MGIQDTIRTCQKKVMNIGEILIYYFHIVVSIVRFTGSVGSISVKQNLHNSIQCFREIKVPIGNGALQFQSMSITIQMRYFIYLFRVLQKQLPYYVQLEKKLQYSGFLRELL